MEVEPHPQIMESLSTELAYTTSERSRNEVLQLGGHDNPLSEEEPIDMDYQESVPVIQELSTINSSKMDERKEIVSEEIIISSSLSSSSSASASSGASASLSLTTENTAHSHPHHHTHTKKKHSLNIIHKINSYIQSQWIYNAPTIIDGLTQMKRYIIIYWCCYGGIFPIALSWYAQHNERHPQSILTYIGHSLKSCLNFILPNFIKQRSTFLTDLLTRSPTQWDNRTIQHLATFTAFSSCVLFSTYSWFYFRRRIEEWNEEYNEEDSRVDSYLSTAILEQWFFKWHHHRHTGRRRRNEGIGGLSNITEQQQAMQIKEEEEEAIEIEKIEAEEEEEEEIIKENKGEFEKNEQKKTMKNKKPIENLNISRDLNEILVELELFKMAEQKNSPLITIVDITAATQQYKIYHSMQRILPFHAIQNIAISRYQHRTCAIIFHTFQNDYDNEDTTNESEDIEEYMRRQHESMQRRMIPVLNRHQIGDKEFLSAVCARFLDLKSKDNIWFVMKAHRAIYQKVATFRVADGQLLDTPLVYHQQIGWEPTFSGKWDLWCINVHLRK